MRVAALDLGSNTSLLLIADIQNGVFKEVVLDRTTITKLGQGVHANRRFHPDALKRMRSCLEDYKAEIDRAGCDKVIAVATSAARDVSNGAELIRLGQDLHIPIHIVDGTREAQLTFRGALFDQAQTIGMSVVDVGGGSTEIISEGPHGVAGKSVDVGSVRLTELFVKEDPISQKSLQDVRRYAEEAFSRAGIVSPVDAAKIVAVAGTPTTLACLDQQVEFSEDKIHGYRLSLTSIERWTDRLSKMSSAERAQLPGMQPGREDVIVAGSVILATAVSTLGGVEVLVSTRGVRYGVAMNWEEFV